MKILKSLGFVIVLILSITTNSKSQTNVKYMSFNIRYDNGNDKVYSWENRKSNVVKLINDYDLDIIGMQEVLYNQLEYLKSKLNDYTVVGVGRDNGINEGEFCPIFFNHNKFKLIEQNTFWLSENPSLPGKMGWDAACPRILTWVKLMDLKSNKIIVVANTHLDHVGELSRINSIRLILNKLAIIGNNENVILSGDFNVSSNNSIYRFITNNDILKLNDSYTVSLKNIGEDYTFHNFGNIIRHKREKIDFVFTSLNIGVTNSIVISENEELYGTISDHNPVIVRLAF